MHALVGKLLGIDFEEGTPLGEMLARMLGLELEMEPGEEKLQGLSISKWSWKVCCYLCFSCDCLRCLTQKREWWGSGSITITSENVATNGTGGG